MVEQPDGALDGPPDASSDVSSDAGDVPAELPEAMDAPSETPDAPSETPDTPAETPDTPAETPDASFETPDAPVLDTVEDSPGDPRVDAGDGEVGQPSDGPLVPPPDPPPPPCPPGQFRLPTRASCVPAGDLNGDGKADLIAVNHLEIDALVSDGSRFTYQVWASGAPFYGFDGTAHMIDVTSDGFADAVGFGGFFAAILRSSGLGHPPRYEGWDETITYGYYTFVAEVDGDLGEKADAILVDTVNGEILVQNSLGNAFADPVSWLLSDDLWTFKGVYFADVDADGRADAIGLGPDAVFVSRSNGRAFGAGEVWYQKDYLGSVATFFADVDGDQRADGIRIDDAATWVALSDGSTFREDAVWYLGPLRANLKNLIGDVDGDGRADLILINTSDVSVSLSTGSGFAPPVVWYVGQFRAGTDEDPLRPLVLNFTVAPEIAGGTIF